MRRAPCNMRQCSRGCAIAVRAASDAVAQRMHQQAVQRSRRVLWWRAMFVPSECAMACGMIRSLPPVSFTLLSMYIAASTRFKGSAMPFISQMGSLNCSFGEAIAAHRQQGQRLPHSCTAITACGARHTCSVRRAAGHKQAMLCRARNLEGAHKRAAEALAHHVAGLPPCRIAWPRMWVATSTLQTKGCEHT